MHKYNTLTILQHEGERTSKHSVLVRCKHCKDLGIIGQFCLTRVTLMYEEYLDLKVKK